MKAGNNLQYLRRVFNLSIKEMAFILDKSEGNYSKIERNIIGISLDNASKLSDFFELKLDDLLSGEDHFLAVRINEKGKDYIIRIFEKIKEFRGSTSPPPYRFALVSLT